MKHAVAWGIGVGILLAAMVALVLLAGSGRLSTGMLTDGRTLRVEADNAVRRSIIWTPPRPMGEPFDADTHAFDPTLDARGTLLIFARGRSGGGVDLYESRWDGASWSTPEPIEPLNAPGADDLGPALSADGRMLVFASDREGGAGGFDLWISLRLEDAWTGPEPLPAGINSPFNEYDPAISPNGETLMFASDRPRADGGQPPPDAWRATIRERTARTDFDLFASGFGSGSPSAPVRLDHANSPSDDGTPAFSPAGDYVYFASNRAGGAGGFDLYRFRLLASGYGPIEPVGGPINSARDELDPALHAEGAAIVFSSDRSGMTLADGGAKFDLFESVSREVYPERDPFDWAGLWSIIAPWLLGLLLLALLALLVLLLRRLAPREHWALAWRRLGLLARCVLISALIHALLLLLFAAWQVKTVLESYFRGQGPTQVAVIADAGRGDSLYEQLRTSPDDERLHHAELPAHTIPEPTMQALTDAPPEHPPIEIAADTGTARFELATRPTTTTRAEHRQISPPVATPGFDASRLPVTDRPTPADEAPLPIQTGAGPTPTVALDAPRLTPSDDQPPRPEIAIAAPEVSTPMTAEPRPVPAFHSNRAELPETGTPTPHTRLPEADAGDSVRDAHEPELDALPMPNERLAIRSESPPMESMRDTTVDRPELSPGSESPEAYRIEPLLRAPISPSRPRPGAAMPAVSKRNSFEPVLPHVATEIAEDSDRAREEEVALEPRSPGAIDLSQILPASEPADADSSRIALPRAVVKPPDAPLPGPSLADPRAAAHRVTDSLPEIRGALSSLRLPVATEASEVYPQRSPEVRERLVERGGGSEQTERAVALALDWLARHQHADGRWSSQGFDDACGSCDGRARYAFDAATTGLALLCFLGADHGGAGGESVFDERVHRGVVWLVSRQHDDGDLRDGGTMYTHGIATIALCEAYALSRDPALLDPIRKAVRFIEDARSEGGGWRYDPGQSGDTSVLGWQIMALESARRCGIEVDPLALDAADKWLDSVATGRARGGYAYQRGMAPTMSMTAEGMFVRQLLGSAREEPRMAESARLVLRETPRWDGNANTYGWYYATLALYQHGGETWDAWNDALVRELLGAQRTDGAAAGSWDPGDQWSTIGGRVYQTALCTLSLEVYYRYLPMYLADAEAEPDDTAPGDRPAGE